MPEFNDPPLPAATVLLLRDEPSLEVLMICRHEASAFAGGALVFPGGRVDPGDRARDWRERADGLAGDETVAAAQVAAIREAYEEVGILLARDQTGAMASAAQALSLNDWRDRVRQDGALFLDLMRRSELRLACDALHLFSHWIPPAGLHRRFDTLFFAARFPPGQHVLEDGDEATEALWTAPAEALKARLAGERKIIFPTARNLELLGVSASVDDVLAAAARREIRPVTPHLVERGGARFLAIPEGLGYPTTEEPLELSGR